MGDSWSGIVDVGSKPIVEREAIATGMILLKPESIDAVANGSSPKGDVREASTISVIQAVKETSRTLPHCHPIPIEGCHVEWVLEERGLRCNVTVRTHWTTGVEMEALTGASVAALTLYDMCKSVSKAMVIESIKLMEKTGGKSGDYHADAG